MGFCFTIMKEDEYYGISAEEDNLSDHTKRMLSAEDSIGSYMSSSGNRKFIYVIIWMIWLILTISVPKLFIVFTIIALFLCIKVVGDLATGSGIEEAFSVSNAYTSYDPSVGYSSYGHPSNTPFRIKHEGKWHYYDLDRGEILGEAKD